jgi:hypothetical protein
MKRAPLFYRSVYDDHALDDCFSDLIHAKLSDQDKIEVGCLIQYFMILKAYGIIELPIDITKHRQGEGPDFSICSNEGLFGVEMTKVTTQDYQVWLKRRMNYRAIKDMNDYLEHKPEQRVGELAQLRVLRKNFKIANYHASVKDMFACDLVLEEDGDCSLDIDVQMEVLQRYIAPVKNQKFRRISMISGSVLFYAINTPEAAILEAPESIPTWLRPQKVMLETPPSELWH